MLLYFRTPLRDCPAPDWSHLHQQAMGVLVLNPPGAADTQAPAHQPQISGSGSPGPGQLEHSLGKQAATEVVCTDPLKRSKSSSVAR